MRLVAHVAEIVIEAACKGCHNNDQATKSIAVTMKAAIGVIGMRHVPTHLKAAQSVNAGGLNRKACSASKWET